MSFLRTEFIDIRNHCIKDEIDIKEEYLIQEVLLPESNALDPTDELVKCGDIFISKSHLILACGYCDDRFNNIRAFGEHVRGQHPKSYGSGTQRYIDTEDICAAIDPGPIIAKSEHAEIGEIFTNCTDESSSSVSENADIQYESKFGGIRFISKIHPVEDQDNFCATCNRQYKNRKSFRRHQLRHTKKTLWQEYPKTECGDIVRPGLYCDICNQHFNTKLTFRKHAASHDTVPIALQQDPNYLNCKYCYKQCADHKEWDEHEGTHDGKLPFSCPHCSDCFPTNSERNIHLIIHNGERPFQCDKCPRAFADASNLKRHIQAHLGIKRYTCEICGKRFLVRNEKDVHMRTHTGEKPFQCEECGRGFVSSSKLTDHRKRHTGIKNYKCDICGSLFYSNVGLKDHKVKHSDARPYHCEECGASFPRRKTLKSHIKIHAAVKEYVCSICGKGFAQSAGLYSHKKSHGEKLNLK